MRYDNAGRIVKQQQWNVSAGNTSTSIDVINGDETDNRKQFYKITAREISRGARKVERRARREKRFDN